MDRKLRLITTPFDDNNTQWTLIPPICHLSVRQSHAVRCDHSSMAKELANQTKWLTIRFAPAHQHLSGRRAVINNIFQNRSDSHFSRNVPDLKTNCIHFYTEITVINPGWPRVSLLATDLCLALDYYGHFLFQYFKLK